MHNTSNAHLKAIFYILGGTFSIALMDMGFKLLTEKYPPVQSLFFRGLIGLLIFTMISTPVGGVHRTIKTKRFPLHLLRAFLVFLGLYCFIKAYTYLPLAFVALLSYTIPILTTLLSIFILKEKITLVKWLAITLGFIGCWFILSPDTIDSKDLNGVLFGLAGGLFFSGVRVIMRLVGDTEKALTTSLWGSLLLLGLSSFIIPSQWVTPQGLDWFVFILVGVAAAATEFLSSQAHRLAPASTIAPFHYTLAIWSTIIGYLIWQEIPSTNVYIGGGILVLSGLLLLYYPPARKMRQHKPESPILQGDNIT